MTILATQRLTKLYSGVTALDSLDLELQPGIIGLVGANGAGKSTLIKILLGLIKPTRGSARLLGFDVTRQEIDLRRHVGYMPEHDCLPTDVSATEFVAHMARMSGLPRSAARERTADTLRHVGLFEERYREMGGYSMGMKQRVKLAQALVHDPRLLLLDEPTNGLDPEARDDMLDLVRRTGEEFGMAVIMASHLLAEIERVCNYLVVIDAGRLVRSAPLASFTERKQVLVVEVEGDPSTLVERLRGDGLTLQQKDGRILVGLDSEKTYDLIRDRIAELGLGLVRLEQGRQSLEDLFRTPEADVDDVAFS
ncbi:MAG: ABC transporter ATP-binding protein [Dehalococcoidia bacterium]|nr:ABC transporter ATP-binding protein [Dehalococcoidia bacterium]